MNLILVNTVEQLLEMGITVHIFMESSYQKLPNRVISNVFGYNVLSTTISPAEKASVQYTTPQSTLASETWVVTSFTLVP